MVRLFSSNTGHIIIIINQAHTADFQTSKLIPEEPGVYGWFIPLWLPENTENAQAYISRIGQYFLYDSTIEGAAEKQFITVEDFTAEVPSNSTGMMTEEHGPWTYPLWPNQSIQGSPSTPYIYDSRPTIEDIATALKFWYDAGDKRRKWCGSVGRDWAIENGFSSENMCNTTATAISTCLENWTPRKRYTIIDTATPKPKYPVGDLI